MISEFTWPNHDLPSDKEAVKKLIERCGFQDDVAYGKTKIFIRTPRTLFTLEELRAQMLVRVVLFLQKVTVMVYRQEGQDSTNGFLSSRNVCGWYSVWIFTFFSLHTCKGYLAVPLQNLKDILSSDV